MSIFGALVAANLIGVAANLDNCGTGVAYGSEQVRFPHWVNVIINVVGFVTALTGAYAGKLVSRYLTPLEAEWAACVVLVCIGLFFWYSAYIHPLIFRNGTQMKIRTPGWKESIVIGFALSFTNIASGFGATVSHALDIWVTSVAIAVWGYVMLWVGNVIGIGIVARFLGKYSSFVAGILLILVGVHQIH